MRLAACLVLPAFLLCCAHARPVLGPVEKKEVWRAVKPPGLRVELVVAGGATPRCLARVSGSGTSVDGHVFGCELKTNDEWKAYVVGWDGSRRSVLVVDERGSQLFVPGTRLEGRAVRDDAASAALDADAFLVAHLAETESGALAKLENFDRAARIAEGEQALASARAELKARCGYEPQVSVDWAAASDAYLLGVGLGDQCADVARALPMLCKNGAALDFLRAEVTRVRCAPGSLGAPETLRSTLSLANGELLFTVNASSNLQDVVLSFLDGQGTPAAEPTPPRPWRGGATLGDRMVLESMLVCGDEKGRTLALGPNVDLLPSDLDAKQRTNLFVGSRSELMRVEPASEWVGGRLFGGATFGFIEPRYAPALKEARFTSLVAASRDWDACVVTCGTRKVTVPALSREEAKRVLREATFLPPGFTRKPHALLRDSSGTYYYVDTSTLPAHEKDFRVFVGQRGQMKQQAMTNTLSDSEGQLFSTKGGELRLTLDVKQPSVWQAGKKKVALRAVPVEENLDVIFVELGVYTGQRLGNPCDDF